MGLVTEFLLCNLPVPIGRCLYTLLLLALSHLLTELCNESSGDERVRDGLPYQKVIFAKKVFSGASKNSGRVLRAFWRLFQTKER